LRTFAPAPKVQAPIEIPNLDPTNAEIFKALNLITLPDAGDHRRLQASDILLGTEHDFTRVLEFRPHDTHFKTIRTRLRDSTYSLNTISDTAAELPLAWIEMGQASTHLTRTLIDSGARGDFMSEAFARRNNFAIELSSVQVKVADNCSVPAAGTTTIPLRLGETSSDVTFVVLRDCAYEAILGTHFFYQHFASIDFEERQVCLTVASGKSKHKVKLPFIPAGVPLIATQDVNVDAGTVANVPVTPDPT
jgi:hypothetical protein